MRRNFMSSRGIIGSCNLKDRTKIPKFVWDFPRFTRHALCLRALTTDFESLCLGADFTCSSSKYIINIRSSSCELVFFDLTKTETHRQVFTQIRSVTFHENPSVVIWERQEDRRPGRHDEVSSHVSQVAV